GQAVTITATVTDETGLVGVLLHYKIGDAGWVTAVMTADGSLYTAEIPAADWGTEVLYYVLAMDVLDYYTSQGTELDPLSYIVGDNVLPTVSVSGPVDGSDVTGNVTFYISGWDEGSDVDYAEMIINGTVVWSGSTLPSSILWITTEMPNDAYSITFRLYDNAGNHAFTELEYQVANPVGFGAIGSALSSFIQVYGFFLGAATVVILLVVVKVAARRRGGGIE
ncbi:MAG: Ig-like domain-containing protein, partial [Candidatus Thorarchaeota archaeon]